MFDGKSGVNNHSKLDFFKFSVSDLTSQQIIQSASYLVHELTSLRRLLDNLLTMQLVISQVVD